MSSLRPAAIVAAMFHLIGGSLAEAAEPVGPTCSCERCQEAWWRNQTPNQESPRAKIIQGLRRPGAA